MFDIEYYNRYNQRIFTPGSTISGGAPVTGAVSDILYSNLPANLVLVSSASGKVITSSGDAAKIANINDTTGPIQAQINGKEPILTKGNLTEVTSSVLTISGGTGAVIGAGSTIQVKQATGGQSGYLSSSDWNTFNSKLGTALPNTNVWIGDGGGVAQARSISGDVSITNLGVVTVSPGAIDNSKISVSAGIQFSKMENLTQNLALVSSGSGDVSVSAVTSSELALLSGLTGGSLQSQLASKLSATITTPALGNILYYNGSAWVNFPRGTNGQILSSTSTTIQWVNSSSNVPAGGSTNNVLRKVTGADYDTGWVAITASMISDVTASAAQINALTTGYYDATSSVQTQINSKLSKSLPNNYMFVGNGSGEASYLAAGTDGYVLTSVGGAPTWVSPGSGGTVTSVGASGGTTGMSFGGSPITISGTLTLTGTLAAAHGGTGQSSYTVGDILYASTTTALSKLAAGTLGYVLTSGGPGVAPSWQAASGGGGGGGITNTAAANEMMKSDGTNAVPSGVFSTTAGSLIMGTGLTGASRSITMAGSATDVGLDIFSKGAGGIALYAGSYSFLLNTGTNGARVHTIDTSTNTSINALTLRRESSGTPAVGIGASLQYDVHTSGSNFEIGAKIDAITTNVGAGTEAFDLVFSTMAGGAAAAEAFRITSLGNLTIGAGLAGTDRTINAAGSGTDINIVLTPKGTGFVDITSGASLRILGGTESITYIDATTSSIINLLQLTRQTSGTPAVGMGVGLSFTTQSFNGSYIQSVAIDLTGGSEDFDLVFKNMTAGAVAAEAFRISSLGDLTIGTGLAGTSRTITADGSGANVGLTFALKGNAAVNFNNTQNFNISYGTGVLGIDTQAFSLTATKTSANTSPLSFIAANGISGSTTGNDVLVRAGNGFGTGATNGGNIYVMPGLKNSTGTTGNIALLASSGVNFQAMELGLFMANSVTAPSGNPAGGAFLWVDPLTQLPKWRVPGGTVYTLTDTGAGESVLEAEIDFGSSEDTDVSVFVSDASITSNSKIVCSVSAKATADHGIDDIVSTNIVIFAGNVQAGSGFTIYAKALDATYGKYKVNYIVQY